MNTNRYCFQYGDGYDRTITHNFSVSEDATPQDVFEHFCDFLNGVYGWNVKEYFEDTTS
jgi:hypothetical protein